MTDTPSTTIDLVELTVEQAQAAFADGAPQEGATRQGVAAFPDAREEMRDAGLAFFRPGEAEPILYEDFLPVSAAGIFRSNLGRDDRPAALAGGERARFEAALGARVLDEMALYAAEAEGIRGAI